MLMVRQLMPCVAYCHLCQTPHPHFSSGILTATVLNVDLRAHYLVLGVLRFGKFCQLIYCVEEISSIYLFISGQYSA